MSPIQSSTQPAYLWNLQPTSAQAPYLGQAWSKMQIGRVKISGNEKWVGFMGGGYDGTSCTPATGGSVSEACNTVATGSSGKSFNVVDLTNGQILWQFTYGTAATSTTNPNMTFDLAGSPIAFDMDGDGFVDTAYIGDLGGNIWRFRFCTADPLCSSCGLSSYTASPSCTSSSYPAALLLILLLLMVPAEHPVGKAASFFSRRMLKEVPAWPLPRILTNKYLRSRKPA